MTNISPSLGTLSKPAMTAILMVLFLAQYSLGQNSLAPVVDAADSEAWIEAYNANVSSEAEESSSASCAPASACDGSCGGSCDGNCGGGVDCNYGFPLWAGSCQPRGSHLGEGCSSPTVLCAPMPMPVYEMTPAAGSCMDGGNCGSELGCCSSVGVGSMLGHGNWCSCGACDGARSNRVDVFGEFLYLRSRNAEVAYAVPVDGPITPTLGNGIQIGRTAIAEMNHEPGFRLGANFYGQNCNGVMGQWTHFESHDVDDINTAAPDVIRSLVTHPLGVNAASDGLRATADYDIDFDMVDLAFRLPWRKCNNWCAEILWGMRYANLNQEFLSTIDFNGTTSVATDIDFNGLGPQVGLSAQRRFGNGCLYAYSQGLASFLVGKFDGQYTQSDSFAGVVVNNSWESGRIVPQLEYELGVGVMSRSGRARVRVGYMVSAWFNTVRTDEFINSVQANNPDGLGDGLTFDGLTVRSEFRF